MKRLKKWILALALAGITTQAAAGTTVAEFIACVDEAYIDEFIIYAQAGDVEGANVLTGSGHCILMTAGLKATVIGTVGMKIRFRVYNGDLNMVLWSITGAVE